MALEDASTVDVVVRSPHHDGYDLILFDGGSVADEMARYRLVLQKLLAYAQFVWSGDLARHHPDAAGRTVRLCVVWTSRPPNEAMLGVDALKPRSGDGQRLPVVYLSQEAYLSAGEATAPARKWWKLW